MKIKQRNKNTNKNKVVAQDIQDRVTVDYAIMYLTYVYCILYELVLDQEGKNEVREVS